MNPVLVRGRDNHAAVIGDSDIVAVASSKRRVDLRR